MTIVEADEVTPISVCNAEQVLGLLRSILAPGGQRDIVAAGFVKEIEVTGNDVNIVFAPDTRSPDKVEKMEAAIRDALAAADVFGEVDIQRERPFSEDEDTLSRAHASERPDLALDAGYGHAGPSPLGGPGEGPRASPVYDGPLSVLQWEINPDDRSASSGNADLNLDGWDFRMWWQEHETGLIYTSIQAMQDDAVEHDGAARSHPVGRMEAVNLVYDKERKAVVAIYGTVRDFRPFVDAFYRSYVLRN
jgi:metal-sulfur cluster biosynthetic enzyme